MKTVLKTIKYIVFSHLKAHLTNSCWSDSVQDQPMKKLIYIWQTVYCMGWVGKGTDNSYFLSKMIFQGQSHKKAD